MIELPNVPMCVLYSIPCLSDMQILGEKLSQYAELKVIRLKTDRHRFV